MDQIWRLKSLCSANQKRLHNGRFRSWKRRCRLPGQSLARAAIHTAEDARLETLIPAPAAQKQSSGGSWLQGTWLLLEGVVIYQGHRANTRKVHERFVVMR